MSLSYPKRRACDIERGDVLQMWVAGSGMGRRVYREVISNESVNGGTQQEIRILVPCVAPKKRRFRKAEPVPTPPCIATLIRDKYEPVIVQVGT